MQRWPGDIVVAVFDPPRRSANQIALPLPCRQPSDEAINTRIRAIRGDQPVPADAPEAIEEAGALALPSNAWERVFRGAAAAEAGTEGTAPTPDEAAAAAKAAAAVAEGGETERRRLEGPLRDYLRRKSKFAMKEFRSTVAKSRLRRDHGEALENNGTHNATLRATEPSDETTAKSRSSHESSLTSIPPRRVVAVGVPSAGPYAAFPVNYLRNAALCRVATTHALYADVDFWPSETL